jgi:hypothetical protein
VKVPQSLLDRREELVAEIDEYERNLTVIKNGFVELDNAIRLIADEPDESFSQADANLDRFAHVGQMGQPPAPAVPPAKPESTGQRAPKRDIKTLILNFLTQSAHQPQSAKEIAKAIEAGIASTESALEHWKKNGVAAEVDGKWHSVAGARAVPRQMPDQPSRQRQVEMAGHPPLWLSRLALPQ